MSTEKERESHVYLAKLAEQAERYDGETQIRAFPCLALKPCVFSAFSGLDFICYSLFFFIELRFLCIQSLGSVSWRISLCFSSFFFFFQFFDFLEDVGFILA